jgi:hypothetical protein
MMHVKDEDKKLRVVRVDKQMIRRIWRMKQHFKRQENIKN